MHAPLISQITGLHLTCIVSSDAAKVANDFAQMRLEAKAEAVFANPDIDLIVIATPNHSHFELAYRGLEMGKHVVVDKPIAISSIETIRLIEKAKENNRLLSVFQNRRWDADFLTIKKILETDRLGEISYFQSNFDRYRPDPKARWREQDFPGSGLWFDLGSHLVDQAVVLFGSPDTVYADLAMQRRGGEAVDYFHVVLHYGKMRVILHSSSLVVAPLSRFVVHGKTGTYFKQGFDTQEDCLKNGRLPGDVKWGFDPNLGSLSLHADNPKVREEANILGNYLAYYEAIKDAILLNRANPISADQMITVMRILELGTQSVQSGKMLHFDSRIFQEEVQSISP